MTDQEKIERLLADVAEIKHALLGDLEHSGYLSRLQRLEEKDSQRAKREFGIWGLLLATLSQFLWRA